MEKEERKKGPLITTIIPTYRRPNLLKRAISSVLNQTYPNFKVCVYDNASGDKTAEIVKKLSQKDPRVCYYCHPRNIGAVHNFNFGLSRVKTPYFSILSDDDILLPNFYEKAMKEFKKYPEAGFVVTQTIIATDKEIKKVSFASYEEKLYQPPESLLKISNWGTITWTGILFSKEVIENIGLLDEKIMGSADYFVMKAASVFPYVVLKLPGAIFFVHKQSLCSIRSEADVIDMYIKILEDIRSNETIPVLIRRIVFQNIRKYIIHTLWAGGLKDVKRMRFSQAEKSAKSLKNDFDENLKSAILYYGARLCKFSSIFYYFFLGLNQIRGFINIKRRAREKELQNVYGAYLKYLNTY